MNYLLKAIEDGLAKITGEGKTQRIHYIATSHSERWSDPEEKVRAEFWAELIYKYEYKPERICFEVKVPRRTPHDLADIVIYGDKDDALKSPWFVFECKRADVSDAEFAQAIEQSCGNRASLGANYAGTIAGLTRRMLRFDKFPAGERDKNIMTDIPARYGKPPEWRFYKNEADKDLSAIPREELRSIIRKCHQTLWEGGRRSPIAAFGEFCKLIFVKHRDEKNPDREDGKPYAFQRRDGESADELMVRIHRLYDAEKLADPTVFEGKINIQPAILAQCVEHLEGISLDRTELDTKGVAFEEFMGSFFKGDFGQYFTPRELIAFAVEILNPERKETVLDPACGSGGFLLYTLDHVIRSANHRFPKHENDPKQHTNHFNYWHGFAANNLFGIEINEELARVAKMNMIIHDDGHTNIVGHDALDFFPKLTEENPGLVKGKFDLILTNPPFGSVIKRAEKGEGYLEQFELRNFLSKNLTGSVTDESGQGEHDAKRGTKVVKDRASIKTEILFLERVHSFLKPGTGRAAIVLPDGILTNSSLKGVRDWLLTHFQLLAVVSLPQFAFAHYDAGVKASIIFMRCLAEGETIPDDAPIFMALAENIGYDATGRKTFAVTVESEAPGKGKVEVLKSDLFDYRVFYEWSTANPKRPDWSERHREIIPDTGLVAQWREFQRDPTPFFVNERKFFAVQLGSLDKRIDPYSNQSQFKKLFEHIHASKYRVATFKELSTQIFSGVTPLAKGDAYVTPPNGVRFIRSGEITADGEVTSTSDVHISAAIHNGMMKRSQVESGDLLIAIVGATIGAVGVFNRDEPANINQAIAAVRLKGDDISSEFACLYLRSSIGQALLDYFKRPVARANINLEEISDIPLIIPPREVQEKIVANSHLRREEARRLRAKAEASLQAAMRSFEEQLLEPVKP